MRVTLPSGTPAEVVRPDGDPVMGLVVAPDIFGLRPLFDDLTARLSLEWDMVACAVEPFPGRGLGDGPASVDARRAAVPSLDDDDNLRDLLEGAAATGCERVGLIGFCMGGMYTLKAARSDRFARLTSFYGMIRVPDEFRSPAQGEPLDHLRAGHPDRVLAIIGEQDLYTPPADVTDLEATGVTVARYPQAEHGFVHDAARPAHRPDDAEDAWARCLHWLRS